MEKAQLSEPFIAEQAPSPAKSSTRSTALRFTLIGFAVVGVVGVISALAVSKANSNEYYSSKLSARGEAIPDPDIYRMQGCPFSKWFNSLPLGFLDWENIMVDKYETAWAKGCESPDLAFVEPEFSNCPLGFDENDHNFNTVLGQGNTLGFVAGSLEISSSIPSSIRTGLFAKPGAVIPIIARFSDFGSDDSAVRLGRLAIKLPYPTSAPTSCPNEIPEAGSWYGEMNLLFTESLDAFPLANYRDIASFTGASDATWDKLMSSVNALRVLAQSGLRFYNARNYGLLGKEYFSQLPYQLGCGKAFKFALSPVQNNCGQGVCCVPNTKSSSKESWARGVSDFLSSCDAAFELRVQVKNLAKDKDTINEDGAASWSEDYISVGTIRLPRQDTTPDTATSKPLAKALADSLDLADFERVGVHKLFLFHPLLTASEHRPLGETNSFRSHFYSTHAKSRYNTILEEIYNKAPSDNKPPHKVPFDALAQDAEVAALTA